MTIKGVMGVIQASNPDSSGASFFDVVNLRSTGQVKVIKRFILIKKKQGNIRAVIALRPFFFCNFLETLSPTLEAFRVENLKGIQNTAKIQKL